MTVDYDAPRRPQVEPEEPTFGDLTGRPAVVSDIDESDLLESYELPGADLSDEELSIRVIPKQPDEFTCTSCFLVHHRSRLALGRSGAVICTDCG